MTEIDHIVKQPSRRTVSQMTPLDWRDWRTEQTEFDSGPRYLDRAIVQKWVGSAPDMIQPPLDHHVFVLHEGGPKLVTRSGGIATQTKVVQSGSCTTIEAGTSYSWSTQGPIAFTHVYVRPDRFSQIVGETYGRDPDTVHLGERIGQFDPLTMQLFEALRPDVIDHDIDPTAEYLLDALIVRVASLTSRGTEFSRSRISLPPVTLRRVCDYVQDNYADRITLDEMARVAGYSRFHFVRAFKEATGTPPYSYLIAVRVQHATKRLLTSDAAIADIAREAGFSTHAQFSTRFKEHVGLSPAEFRFRHSAGKAHFARR